MRYRFYCRIQNAETHEEMKAANRNCNRTLAQAKKDHWMSFADSVSTDKQDLGAVWRKIKKMKGQAIAPEYDFYVSRAYDQVWHAKLLQKLQKIGISGKMYDYIKTFLSGRSMQVRWKGAMSAVKTVSMGVPQGSVIAPLLFNIMVHDVVTAVTGKVVITMYADDLAICEQVVVVFYPQ